MRIYLIINTGGFAMTVFAEGPVAALKISLERSHIRKLKNGRISDETDDHLLHRTEETRRALAANVTGSAAFQISPHVGWMIDEQLY